ncbi:MAG: tRNA 2-selenouridine(34) synthase MnmH [Rubrivivax sp.]|nr:tRNA 2-selenouridine(34) synthase MnmH [Rubrivivax sp.]
MPLSRISGADAARQLNAFSAIIDARSPSEFALDHLPGAVNWPTLTDAERAAIGTEYKQVSAFEARKRGAVMAARNIAQHVQDHAMGLSRDWRALIYCWRGGQRSGALALVLGEIGFAVQVIEGGYVAFRRAVLAELETLPRTLALQVLCGRTGSAKSRLLQALAAQGAQVLDLEALACHRGSVLGPLPGQPQPSQKAFETRLWHALRALDPGRPVYAEGESRTIGRLRLPEALLDQLRAAPCIRPDLSVEARVDFLLQDYAHFLQDVESFCERLQALRELRGAAVVQTWQAQARAGQWRTVVRELLEQHYDPIYERSMPRNYPGYNQALPLALPAADPASLADAARRLVETTQPRSGAIPSPRPGSVDPLIA